MKNYSNKKLILTTLAMFICLTNGVAQSNNFGNSNPLTPNGYFDKVYDKDGREYALSDLEIQLDKYNSGSVFVSSITACSAGFFDVYFANGSGMESTTVQAHNDRRQLVCHILENVSGLLGGWASWPSNGRVKILVDNITNYGVTAPSTSSVLGLATGFYAFPSIPSAANPGITENLLQKTIKSKHDAWANLISPVMSTGGSGFYHGVMAFNFANAGYNWFTNYSSSLAASNQLDLYTVILHEITHALGFASLINSNGLSKFGATNNYYGLYDKFLYDKNNVALLTSNGCSPQYGLSFNSSTLNLQPACTASYVQNSTNCSLANIYSSSNLTYMPIYTPACFEPPSSLSHFEDECYPTTNSLNNDLYFTMSNANGNGTNKRYLKPEERKVLCDLGYTVSTTYTSNAVGVGTLTGSLYTYSYSGGSCVPPNIWGLNDGFSGSAYTYTSLGGVINFSINSLPNGILANDATSAVTASCVESVYNNGTVSTNYTSMLITFTPSTNYFGPILLRYIPVDASGNKGNITYIYAFVNPSNCVPASPCDLVQNGTFESNVACGPMQGSTSGVNTSCWLPFSLSPDLFVAGCNSYSPSANLGVSTYSSSFNSSQLPFTSSGGTNNNAIIGLGSYDSGQNIDLSESYANFLGSPLISGQVYKLSFWAYEFVGSKLDPLAGPLAQSVNTSSVPMVLTFAGSNQFAASSSMTFPNPGVNSIKSVTLASAFNTWRNYNVTFTYTPGFNSNWLYVGADQFLGHNVLMNVLPGNTTGYLFYVLLDNISIKPISQSAQFTLPNLNMCTSQGYTDLAQYVSIPGGTFTGTGVVPSLPLYNFNVPATLTNSLYTITYTYSDNINCLQTAVQQVSLGAVNIGVTLGFQTYTNCTNGASTISVISPTTSLNYTWMPGNGSSNSYTVNPSNPTTYTASAISSSSCTYVGTIQISPNIPTFTLVTSSLSICPGTTTSILALGTFSSVYWTPNNFIGNPLIITPSVTTTYTAMATSSLNCISFHSITINVSNYTTSAIASSTNICAGQTVTLQAIGSSTAITPYWTPTGYSGNPLIVSPTFNTTYTVSILDPGGCSSTRTVPVNVTNFSISPSSVNSCIGSLGTLTALGNYTSLVWQPGGQTTNSIVVTVAANTTYSAIASFSNGCVTTQTFAFGTIDVPFPNYQIKSVYPVVCAGNSETLTVFSNFTSMANTTWTWLPSGSTSSSIVITPTTNITYSALVTNSSGCVYMALGAVNISTSCCTGSFSAMPNASAGTQTISGSKAVNGNIIIPSSGNLTLVGEFIFAPNVKIVVSNGAVLNIRDAHLYACSTNMWQGLQVLDGGRITVSKSTKDNMIEDAIIAIDASNQITNPFTSIIDVSNTTFNKNYIGINISNYSKTLATYPFKIEKCVFTCRNFNIPVGSLTWPQTGSTSNATGLNADLRYATALTNLLPAPFLGQVGFTVTTLKNPYVTQSSQTAIQLTNVGLTSSGIAYAITIGDGASMANFNLFDSHGKFIEATNSNVKSFNNVFQNTKLINGQPGIGISIKNVYSNQNVIDAWLELTSPVTPSLNFNRFYDCHTAINSNNTATLSVQYAQFKSTQSNTVTSSLSDLGQFGIYITGNRYHSYNIRYNSFYNVSTGIYGNVYPGFINPFTSGTLVGQVWGTFSITYNLFSPSTTTAVGNSYVGTGVKIENVIHTRGTGFNTSIIPVNPINGLRIQYNTFDKVYRGVHVLNFSNSSFGKFTANNTIKLKKDHVTSNAQWGVNHENNYFGVANTNAIAGFTTTSTSPLIGVFVSMNTTGSAQCNTLSVLPKCLEFSNGNSLVVRNNTMTPSSTVVNGSKGLTLSSNGIILTQGSFNSPSDNVWQGVWTSHFNTFTDLTSNAANSKIWRRTLAVYNPTVNGGLVAAAAYSVPGNLIPGNNSALYSSACSTLTLPNKGPNNPKSIYALAIAGGSMTYSGFYQSETAEINRYLLYEDLEEDSALLNSNSALQTFYSNNQAGPIGTLIQIGQLLSEGQLNSANTALTGFTENTGIEANYKRFYSFYIKHFDPNQGLSAADKVLLAALAQKCPFIDGPIIYNARALNTLVTGSISLYNDTGCDSQGQSLMSNENGGELGRTFKNSQNKSDEPENVGSIYHLFPNPATDQLYIVSATENEELQIAIKDLSNKLVLQATIQIQNYQANIKLDLINGAYLVSLIRANNEHINSKLIITK